MTYAEIIRDIESQVRIERVKQWDKEGCIYITVACLDTKKFNRLCNRYNNIVPDDRKPTEYIGICRRA